MKKQQVSLAIGIPTINQWPTLREYLTMYVNDYPGIDIFIVDNGKQECGITRALPPDYKGKVTFFHEEKNIGVAASWNKLCENIFEAGHTHAMIVNDDVYPGINSTKLLSLIEIYPRDLYKTSRDNMSVFILPRTTFVKVGRFDTIFYPAYFEDRDYLRRMKLRGCSIMTSIKFDPAIYNESLSSKKDPSLLDRFDFNEQLYIEMWGGKPGFEKFSVPRKGSKRTMQDPGDL